MINRIDEEKLKHQLTLKNKALLVQSIDLYTCYKGKIEMTHM